MYCTLTPLLSAWNPWVTGRRASQSRLDFPCFQVRAWPAGPGPCRGEVNGAPAKLFSVPGASVKIFAPVRVACWSLSVLRRSQRRASKTFFGPRCLYQIFVTVSGVLVLVSSAPAKFWSVSPNRDAPIFCAKRSAHPKKIFDHG